MVSVRISVLINVEVIEYVIGVNMWFFWCCRVKIGICVVMMISIEKNVGWFIFEVVDRMVDNCVF